MLNVGHCHPRVVAAIQEQAAKLTHVSNLYYTEQAMRLSEALSQQLARRQGVPLQLRAPRPTRRRSSSPAAHQSGGEIVVLRDAFHGRTYGALSATPQEAKQAPFAPLVPGFVVSEKDPAALDAAVGPQTAAVLLEPIQGEGGVLPLSEELLQAARAACDREGAVLIFDEVQTGMGRTGTLWAYEQTGVVPDAITSAKALGGGLPIGALITGEKLADTLPARRPRLDVRGRPGRLRGGARRARDLLRRRAARARRGDGRALRRRARGAAVRVVGARAAGC